MIRRDDLFPIGRLGKPHGVKGDIMFRFTDDVFDRVDIEYLFLDINGLPVPYFIEEYSFYGDNVAAVHFEDVDTSECARRLNGCEVLFPRSLAADAEPCDSLNRFVGMTLVNHANGNAVGVIRHVDDSTANLLFEVATPNGDRLVPAAAELIKAVDNESSTVTVLLPDGLEDI